MTSGEDDNESANRGNEFFVAPFSEGFDSSSEASPQSSVHWVGV